jgi:hypothetical protein
VLSLLATLVTAVVATILSVIAYRLSKRMSRNDLLFEVRGWGDEVVTLLSTAFVLCELDPSKDARGFVIARTQLIARSSALLDQGRFFFPNTYVEEPAMNKPIGFRGIRPEILDLLKLAHELARSLDYGARGIQTNMKRREAFVEVKRHFVSVIQKVVDFRHAPADVLAYEQLLAHLKVPSLPKWVRDQVNSDASFGDLRWI